MVGSSHSALTETYWTPFALGSKLYAWWSADALQSLTLSGNQVVTWADLVAGVAPTQATSGSQPIYDPTGFNGSPCVTFDGIGQFLRVDSNQGNIPNSNGYTIFGVAQQDALVADTGGRYIFSVGTSNGNRKVLGRSVVTGVNRVLGITDATSKNGTTGNFSGRHLVASSIGAANTDLFFDPAADGTAAVAPGSNSSRTVIGAIHTGVGAYWNGKMRDIVVASNSITSDQLTLLNAYLLGHRN